MRIGAIVAALVAAWGFAPIARGADPSPPPGHPSVRRFSTADGLPHDTVYAVTRDRDGYLWIGTQNGAARYDGRRFTTFDMPDAATSNYVRDLLAARDGSLWFARQNGGVVRLKDGRTTVLGVAQGLPSGRVNTVAESPGPDGAPTVYAGLHGGGVCRLAGDRFVPVEAEATASWRVWKLLHARLPGREATLLAASEEGLFALEKGRFVRVPVDTGGARASFNTIVTVGQGDSVTAYLGTYGAGVVVVSPTGTSRIDATRGLPANLVTALAATPGPGGRPIVWVGTRGGGLARIDGDRARAVALDARANEVFGLASGLGDGALWVGIRAFGLARLALTPFTALDVWSGLPSDNVGDIRLVPRPGGDEIWLSTNRGVGIYRDGEVRVLDTRNGIPGREIGFFALTGPPARPDVWTGTLANGLARLRDGAPTVVLDVAHGFVTDRIFALLATPEGLWVGTDLGKLALVDPESTGTLAVVGGVPHNEVLNLARSPDGTLWAATRSGLAVVRDRKVVRLLTSADGLPNDEVLVLSILPGPAGDELWAGTRGGTARLPLPVNDLASARFTRVPGLPDGVANAAVQAILPDGRGNVFLGTHRGIVRIAPGGVRVFTTTDGVPSNIAAWGGLVDADGRIWTTTSGGAAILDTEAEGLAPGPPAPLVIESILRNDKPVSGSTSGVVLRHDESLSLELALLSFASATGVTYRAQLVGLEPRPSEPAPAPVFRYSRLPAGRYVFRGWGRDQRGVESGPVELAFSVTEAPWRTLPALALYVVGFVLALAGLLRLRTKALRARARELEALVEARTHELVAARDQALAGSRTKDAFLTNVSHELRTPLNAILGYAELLREELPGRADDLMDDVGRIQTAAQMQLGLVNEILDLSKVEAGRIELHLTTFGVDELVSTVIDTIRPQATRNGNKVVVTGSPGAGEIRADRTRLLQVLLNLLSNASKFTKDGVITLAVTRLKGAAGEEVVFRVTDTGIGMTEVQMERLFQPFLQADASTSATYGGTGLGLVIAKRFCELMGGDLGVESEAGKGSRFTAWIPVSVEEARGRAGAGGGAAVSGRSVAAAILVVFLSAHAAVGSRTDRGESGRTTMAGSSTTRSDALERDGQRSAFRLLDRAGGTFRDEAGKVFAEVTAGGHRGEPDLGLDYDEAPRTRPHDAMSVAVPGLFSRAPPSCTTRFGLGETGRGVASRFSTIGTDR